MQVPPVQREAIQLIAVALAGVAIIALGMVWLWLRKNA